MRIVAGELRGRRIEAPTGEGTRPTVDRVREALFSSLYSLRGGFEHAIVLDAFAGSGALGIEAISRGAAYAVFYESDAHAADTVARNVRSCGIASDVVRIVKRDVLSAPPANQSPPFDLVFLDPPYAYDAQRVLDMVRSLADGGAMSPQAIIVYEHDLKAKEAVSSAAVKSGFAVHAQKKYGKTAVTLMEASEESL